MIRKVYESPSRRLTQKTEIMLQNITSGLLDSRIPLSLVSRGTDKGTVLESRGERILFTECNMMSNVSHSGG